MILPAQQNRWMGYPAVPDAVKEALGMYPPVIQQILYNRGIQDAVSASRYLTASAELGDPFQLKDLQKAVERLLRALDRREVIAVYGDYDVDGVTATALLVEVLRVFGANARPYIPNRFDEGYGLNQEALTKLAKEDVRVVVTVDCGIRSPREAELARTLGIDLIISDHHHPAQELPEALAVICPKREDDSYPDDDLSGVGLAYKIAQGLFEARPHPDYRADDWVELVALGTIADIVPLRGENRVLVRRGMEQLRQRARQGIVSLAGVAGINLSRLNVGDVGYKLGPRLNAAGRLESALDALHLLMTREVEEAGRLAQKLDRQNRERQELTRRMQEEAVRMAETEGQDTLLFAFSPDFNAGVVGLTASKLVEAFYRPAVVGQVEAEVTRASCRSIPEFHITQALDVCRDLLVRHGGHSLAAGFTVRNENLSALRERLMEVAREKLSGQELTPVLRYDVELPLRDLHPNLLPLLDQLEPTGQGNPGVSFVTRGLKVVSARRIGSDQSHLKLVLTDGWITYDAIAFGKGSWVEQMPERMDVLYQYQRNEYNGRSSLQLHIHDLRPSEG